MGLILRLDVINRRWKSQNKAKNLKWTENEYVQVKILNENEKKPGLHTSEK
jgi:hypothetical protein